MDQIIRRAERRDIPRLVELGEEFALLSQPIHTFSVSRKAIIEFTNEIVEGARCVGIVLEVDGVIQGILAGIASKIYFSEDVALQEIAWYVKHGFRGGAMIDAFEIAGKALGCNRVVVGNKPQYYDLSGFYERRGYKLLEQQYIKSIEV